MLDSRPVIRPVVVLALATLAACGGGPASVSESDPGWRLRGAAYVNVRTMDQKTPADLFEMGAAHHEARRHEQAAALFRVLAETAPEPALRGNALFMHGQTLMIAGAFPDAYRDFDAYQARFPDGDLVSRARFNMMECALGLARVGQRDTFLGLPIVLSSKAGVELLKQTLQRFPREEFSDEFVLRLAQFHHSEGDLDLAELELKFLLSDPTYKVSNSVPHALLLAGRIGLERYQGLSYDHKTLADAKRAYEQFILDYKDIDPERARELGIEKLDVLLATAQRGILYVNEKLAERELALAEYYDDRGHAAAARVYIAYLKRTYPNTKVYREKAKAAFPKLVEELEKSAP